MTIQNIEDVMDRIMNLNKNLTEESLHTLLSASGWDKEDIMEGLHIFRSTRGNVTPANPIQNETKINKIDFEPAPRYSINTEEKIVEKNIPTPIPQPVEDYTLNLKTKSQDVVDNNINTDSLNILNSNDVKDDYSIESKKEINNNLNSPISSSTTAENTDIKDYSIDSHIYKSNVNDSTSYNKENLNTNHKSINISKIIFMILLLILLGLVAGFLWSKNLFNNLNNDTSLNTKTYNTQIVDTNQNVNNNLNSTSTVSSNLQDKSQFDNLVNEVEKLKAELLDYKSSAKPTTQTIVKYISQKGKTGASGRGIASIVATSSGFIINYTDNTSNVVPYSTTTILNMLETQAICFKDNNSTTTGYLINDICLDKNKVTNLLNN